MKRRAWIAGAVTFIALAGGVAMTVRLVNKAADSPSGVAPGAVNFLENPSGNRGPLNRVERRWLVPYADGFTVHYGFAFRNPLDHPITLNGLEFEPDPDVFGSYGGSAIFKLPYPPLVMVKNQVIAPGEGRLYEVQFTLDVCSRFPPVSRLDIRHHVIMYAAGDQQGRFDVWLREPISILPPPKGDCPSAPD
jgi:hypothetical protein